MRKRPGIITPEPLSGSSAGQAAYDDLPSSIPENRPQVKSCGRYFYVYDRVGRVKDAGGVTENCAYQGQSRHTGIRRVTGDNINPAAPRSKTQALTLRYIGSDQYSGWTLRTSTW